MFKKEIRLLMHDRLKRKFFFKYWLKKKLTDVFLRTSSLNFITKQLISTKTSDVIFRKGNASVYKNRCVLTGRSYAVDSRYKQSRFAIRLATNNALFSSLKRASW